LRQTILRTLYELYVWDVALGGFGIASEVPDIIVEYGTPDERRMVAQWVEKALPAGHLHDDFSRSWKRQQLGALLLALEEEELDDDAYLQRCRETGRLDDLVTRLLELERTDEAVREIKKAGDYDVLRLASLFEQHHQEERIAAEIETRLIKDPDRRLVEWLQKYAERTKDYERAL